MDTILMVVAFLLFVAQAVAWVVLPSKVAPTAIEEVKAPAMEPQAIPA